ncbi:MAG: hypothetical protein ACK5JT_18225, partial [Hyphomicrobiaceae bacterium]
MIVLAIVPLVLFGAAIAYIKLLFGSIPLQFIAPRVASAITSHTGAKRVEVGDVSLLRLPNGSYEMSLDKVELNLPSASTNVQVEKAVLGLDLGSLLKGHVMPRSLVLRGAVIDLTDLTDHVLDAQPGQARKVGHAPSSPGGQAAARSDGRSESLPARAPDTGTSREAPDLLGKRMRATMAQVLASLAHWRKLKRKGAGGLDKVTLLDSKILIEDVDVRSTWLAPHIDVILARENDMAAIRIAGQIKSDGRTMDIDFAVKEARGRHGARMTFSASGVVPKQLASHM